MCKQYGKITIKWGAIHTKDSYLIVRALQGGKSYYVLQPVLKFYYVLQVLEILLQSIWNLVNYKLFEILLQGFEV